MRKMLGQKNTKLPIARSNKMNERFGWFSVPGLVVFFLSQAYEMILEGVIVGLLLVLLWQEKGMQCKAREVNKFLRNGQGKVNGSAM